MLYNDTTKEPIDAEARFWDEMEKKYWEPLKKKKWRIVIPHKTVYEMTEDVASKKWYFDNKKL